MTRVEPERPYLDAKPRRGRPPLSPYIANIDNPVNAIARLHRWKNGEYADDHPGRPWNSFELDWYSRVRQENLERQQALYDRSMAMNGPPQIVMPQRMERP